MARRGHGEGSVYRVTAANGRVFWRGAFTIPGGVGGKQVRRTVSGATMREARDKLRAFQREIESGVLPDHVTVEQWVRHWLDRVSRSRLTSRQTAANYAAQWIYGQLGHIGLRDLREDHIRAWHKTMGEHRSKRAPDGLAPDTIRRIHSTLQAALTAAIRERKIVINVAANVLPPAMDRNSHHDQLTPDEMRKVIDACLAPRQRARLALAFASIRQSEALALDWSSIVGGIVSVRQPCTASKGRAWSLSPWASPRNHCATYPYPQPLRRSSRHGASSQGAAAGCSPVTTPRIRRTAAATTRRGPTRCPPPRSDMSHCMELAAPPHQSSRRSPHALQPTTWTTAESR